MHMSDALISATVGGTMLAATVGLAAWSAKKVKLEQEDGKIPLMGVMGAFVFAVQMINFSIPATGSSGHLGGGLLLAILLGPYAGFLTMASVLLIQALFFGDGGLLAFGCNVFNLGFFTCMFTYPLLYRRMTRKGSTAGRIMLASLVAAVVGLQLGAFSVVLQTLLSGKTELPFGTFVLLMQPIHLAIGLVEGLVTAAVVTFVWKARPELIERLPAATPNPAANRKVLVGLLIAVLVIGGLFSWFASANPDGLEWAMEQTAGTAELEASGPVHQALAWLQEKTSFLPDYGFRNSDAGEPEAAAWPAVDAGTSVAGLVGGALTLILAAAIGLAIGAVKRKKSKA